MQTARRFNVFVMLLVALWLAGCAAAPPAWPTPIAPSGPRGEDYYKTYAVAGVTYDALARDTERYEQKIVPLAGRVLQVEEDGAGAVLRLGVDGDSQAVVIVNYPGYGAGRVLVNDNVRLYGTVIGRIDYETVLGQQVTAPAVEAGFLRVVD
jgi:hypothetical protein